MQFNGFASIAAYERECARVGFTTERQTCHKNGEDFLLLITRSTTASSTSVDTWHLFTADETREVLSGIIRQTGPSAAAQLAQSGYFSDTPAEDVPAPAVELYPEDTDGDWQQYALFA